MSDTNSNPNHPRLLSFTLDDWHVLGGQVSVSLQNGVVVLVGRNGAGKSAILEGFEAISLLAIGRFRQTQQANYESIPKILNIEVLTPENRRLEYKYELIALTPSTDDSDIDDFTNDNSDEIQFLWNDCCQYLDGQNEILWNTENGITSFNSKDGEIIPLPWRTSFSKKTHLLKKQQLELPREMQWIYTVLRRILILGKASYRHGFERREIPMSVYDVGISPSKYESLEYSLIRKIWHLEDAGELDELESVCQRVGIGNKITVRKFFPSETPIEDIKGIEYIFLVLLDGINIGLLSDGTLRILSILIELINLNSSTTIIIEEPETQIHPGMLEKLLNEIEAYTFDKNLILSTHSPQVVAWNSPENINLVHRKDGRTFVRKLDEDEICNVIEYISDEGDLGEWIYSGILDEQD